MIASDFADNIMVVEGEDLTSLGLRSSIDFVEGNNQNQDTEPPFFKIPPLVDEDFEYSNWGDLSIEYGTGIIDFLSLIHI